MERDGKIDIALKHLKKGVIKPTDIPTIRNQMNLVYGDIKSDDFNSEDTRRAWPYTLISVLSGRSNSFMIDDETLELLEPRVEYVLRFMMTESESTVIKKRFKHYLTLEEIANDMNISKERVRMIEQKALRKLRHPSRWTKITCGINFENDIIELQERVNAKEKELSSKLHLLRAKIEKIDAVLKEFGFDLKLTTPEDESPIDVLGLSVRSYNCLKRSGVNTIKELTLMTENELRNVRNLGPRCTEEVIVALEKFGYSLKINEKDPDFDPVEMYGNPYLKKPSFNTN